MLPKQGLNRPVSTSDRLSGCVSPYVHSGMLAPAQTSWVSVELLWVRYDINWSTPRDYTSCVVGFCMGRMGISKTRGASFGGGIGSRSPL